MKIISIVIIFLMTAGCQNRAREILQSRGFQNVEVSGLDFGFHLDWCGKSPRYSFTAVSNRQMVRGYVCTQTFFIDPVYVDD